MIARTVSAITPAGPAPTFDVPRIERITIDGRMNDWGEQGFRVDILTDERGAALSPDDLDAVFRLGWDDRGLLILAQVEDDIHVESPNASELWRNDSLELFLAMDAGTMDMVQAIVSPGMAAEYPEVRIQTNDYRTGEFTGQTQKYEAQRVRDGDRYTLEILMPWKNLGTIPREGQTYRFQFYVDEADGSDREWVGLWFPRFGTHADKTAMHRIRLAAEPSDPVVARAGAEYVKFSSLRVSVTATREQVGQVVRVLDGETVLGTALLEENDGRTKAMLNLPAPPSGKSYSALRVELARGEVAQLELPDLAGLRIRELLREDFVCVPGVLSGPQFPACDFRNSFKAGALLGAYHIDTVYYDANMNPVTTPASTGRYAAVATITPETSPPLRRFVTLFRTPSPPEDFAWWWYDMNLRPHFPDWMGLSQAVLSAHADELSVAATGSGASFRDIGVTRLSADGRS